MTVGQLRASLALWQRRQRFRKSQHTLAVKGSNPLSIARWGDLLREARRNVVLREKQLAEHEGATPRMITAGQLGLRFQYVWGQKGPIHNGAGHYTAGHRCETDADLIREMRSDHAFHAGKGWGGLSYEAMVANNGTIGFGNPMNRKSAAVALHNTGLVNICCPGTTGDRMTTAQMASVKWLMDNWHTRKVPAAHRLPVNARRLHWLPHNRFPDQSTACPGVMAQDYERIWHG